MSDFLTFMAAPAAGCLVMSLLFTFFGIHVLKRGIVFIDLSMAQLAALGTSLAFALGMEEDSTGAILLSLGAVLTGALFFTLVRLLNPRISQESIIGIVYVAAASLAVIVADQSPRAAEHIQHTLNGSILWISWKDVFTLLAAFTLLAIPLRLIRKRLAVFSDKPLEQEPYTREWALWDFIFYLTLGLAIAVCIHSAGIFLIFTLLIIPAASGIQLFDSFGGQWLAGTASGILISGIGLILSFNFDLPTGPTVVVVFALSYLILLTAVRFLTARQKISG
ncbi:MAG: hypothetical protein GWM98_22525 [Nitrospinaceae bacterium]|nr:metal ABC transporter permease [Nitrospinaceae bacterium]NIR56718.1 metal ABC transporter permease [Nitrospinaceae bacterium]NIS87167.1 metal ABC transporter permease [Nitrospinaceae bacterium]NIT84036.1 metal ABC transporter permease [Nitrospinaceae bacterium]NIU46219.1 metal ABC transporter permease [Nitrospinaceae bacterium]